MTKPTVQELADRVELLSHLMEGHEKRIHELEARSTAYGKHSMHMANAVNSNAEALKQTQADIKFSLQAHIGLINNVLYKFTPSVETTLINPNPLHYLEKSDTLVKPTLGN